MLSLSGSIVIISFFPLCLIAWTDTEIIRWLIETVTFRAPSLSSRPYPSAARTGISPSESIPMVSPADTADAEGPEGPGSPGSANTSYSVALYKLIVLFAILKQQYKVERKIRHKLCPELKIIDAYQSILFKLNQTRYTLWAAYRVDWFVRLGSADGVPLSRW